MRARDSCVARSIGRPSPVVQSDAPSVLTPRLPRLVVRVHSMVHTQPTVFPRAYPIPAQPLHVQTLRENGLTVVSVLHTSSTHLCCHPAVLQEPAKRFALDQMVMLLRSAMEARNLNLIEFNLATGQLPGLAAHLPSMRSPTVSPLQGGDAVAVKIAVQRQVLPSLVALIKQYGGTDLLVTAVGQTIA